MENESRRISDLPDELLLKVLSSSLPSKEVVATSILSKRWRSLWEEVKTLMYDGDSFTRTYWRFTEFLSRRPSVDSLHLKLHPHVGNTDLKTLVNIAISLSLRELRIEMICGFFEFPKSFYIFSQLETIILEKQNLVDVPPNVRLVSLRRLHLLSVKFQGDESVEKLLSACPRLEDLVVTQRSYTNVMLFNIRVPTLRSLCIDNTSGNHRPKGVYGFVINAPSLRFFSIRDSFSNYLWFGNMPELVKASVNVVCDKPDKFLGSLASTQSLSLCSVTSSQTPYPPIGTSFLSLDHLELCSCSKEWLNLLTFMLNDAPRLRVLKLKLKHCVKKEAMDPWNKPDTVPECLSSHLEIFEWRQYKGTEQEREAAKYIVAKGSCLKKATFYSESAEKDGMLKELECVARGSKTCSLVLK
ncbi:unnamed protein product [Microthlaspi erraticum]|uniref:FBD domain-containing protein n=1 Tax=Microthlaspi erraticum TaxID=1685480 RepID=A0A6D2K2Q6_9BRAS|nr:unnamed protein product [Microthlaspi erraticum]